MPPIVSIFNKNLDMVTENININPSANVDDALSILKTNFFRLNHSISIAKKYLLNQAPDLADNVGGIGETLGTLAAYHTGILQPSSDVLKTFKFNFNNNSNINLSFNIPSFDIHDLPPGIDIIDYIPSVQNNCDFVDGDIIIFPGLPCALPEVAMCKKTLTKKILGKKINLGTVQYPCGYKQKTIGSIVLNKNDSASEKLYSFPGFNFNCQGSMNISGEMTIEMTTGLPVDLFTKILKENDITIYNLITNNNTKPITDVSLALKAIFNSKPNFQWFLNFAKYAIAYNTGGLTILNICITSIKINSTCSLKYLGAAYGSDSIFNINNLSYSENNYELLQNGRYISASISTSADLNFSIGLGSYRIGQLYKDATEANNFLGLIIKMIDSEKNKLTSGMRLTELRAASNFLNNQLNSENLSNTPFRIPTFVNMLKNVKTKVDLSLSLTFGLKEPPLLCLNGTICFTFAQIIEFIKKYLSDFIVDAILATPDAQLFLVNIQLDAIEFIIKPTKLPNSVTSQVNILNKKFDYVRNLFKGYITIGVMESTSFLQKMIPNKNTTYNVTVPFPIL
jgi:hypothetical protein